MALSMNDWGRRIAAPVAAIGAPSGPLLARAKTLME